MLCITRGATGALTVMALVTLLAAASGAGAATAHKRKAPARTDAWFARYSPKALRVEYPTLDEGLLSILAGGPPSKAHPPRVMDVPGRIEPLLGQVIRRQDDPDAVAPVPGAPGAGPGTTPEQPVTSSVLRRSMEEDVAPVPPAGAPGSATSSLRPLVPFATPDKKPSGAPPPPPLPPLPAEQRAAKAAPRIGPGTPEERRYANLYRKTEPTRGYTGPGKRVDYVRVRPEVTRKDRWNAGFPDYAVHTRGKLINPYDQNILKGDFPIAGDRTFLVLTGISDTLVEERHLPTPSNIPALRAGSFRVFGDPAQHAFKQQFTFTANLFDGDTAFEPPRWQLRITPVFNVDNTLRLNEVGVTEPDVRKGPERERFDIGIQELFAEARIAITSPFFDFVSMRLGRQAFVSDFRGFIFSNNNQGIRIFGNGASNRNSYNLVYFDMVEHETNSELLLGDPNPERGQKVFMANFYRQDFANIEGYTVGVNYHNNRDEPSFLFDLNGFLARPDPVGRFRQHQVDSHYVGLVGDGHFQWLNVSHAYYHVWGDDSFNNLAGRPVEIDAQMAAMEASVDKDWLRYKLSLFYASGDNNPQDGSAQGFDSIIDDVNFAGGPFSFWVRQGIRLQGVGLKQRVSLVPDLRTSKLQGQANHVNPGLQLFGLGTDAEITPKLKMLLNVNLLRFDTTEPLQLFLFQRTVPRGIGIDYSLGAQYRPELNQNIVIDLGVAGLMPGDGFRAIYETDKGLYQAFTNVKLTF